VAPDRLREQTAPEWFDRYRARIEESRLPKGQEAREQYAELIGADGFHLLAAIYAPSTPAHLRELPAVQILRHTWICQYYAQEGRLRWRKAEDLPPAALRSDSPYDPEAHYGNKRSQTWTGYKVHVTETCDDNEVHLITHVETTLAGVTDSELSTPIHEALAQRALLPDEHFLDSGYVDADLLVRSQNELGIEVIGPVRASFQLASTSGARLRCGTLSGGLASPAGDLPARSYQYVLGASSRCPGQPGDQCQIFPH
jgi:transposase